MSKNTGTVIQIMGPVLDIRFPEGMLPELLNAIEVPNGNETVVAEVAQHIGDNGAQENDNGRREDKEKEGEEHLGGGFVGEFLGAFKPFATELFGLDTQDGAEANAEFVRLNEGGAEGFELRNAHTIGEITEGYLTRGADLNLALHP